MKRAYNTNLGYKIDFNHKQIIINYKFEKNAQDPSSEEFELLMKLQNDLDGFRPVVQSGRNVRTAHVNKGLTYAHMDSHMKAYDNYTELMDRFETVKTLSKPLASPYHYVQHWFFLQFPDYADVEKSVHKAYGGLVELVSAPSLEGFNLKENDSLMN